MRAALRADRTGKAADCDAQTVSADEERKSGMGCREDSRLLHYYKKKKDKNAGGLH